MVIYKNTYYEELVSNGYTLISNLQKNWVEFKNVNKSLEYKELCDRYNKISNDVIVFLKLMAEIKQNFGDYYDTPLYFERSLLLIAEISLIRNDVINIKFCTKYINKAKEAIDAMYNEAISMELFIENKEKYNEENNTEERNSTDN